MFILSILYYWKKDRIFLRSLLAYLKTDIEKIVCFLNCQVEYVNVKNKIKVCFKTWYIWIWFIRKVISRSHIFKWEPLCLLLLWNKWVWLRRKAGPWEGWCGILAWGSVSGKGKHRGWLEWGYVLALLVASWGNCEAQNNLSWTWKRSCSACITWSHPRVLGRFPGAWTAPKIKVLCLQATATQFHVHESQPLNKW